MKFQTLTIENFLTVGLAQVNLEDRGLHLIQGVNEDNSSATSNGAGKSSIVDALCWALFGVTARKVKGDKVVHNVRKKDCRVSITLRHGDNVYLIQRHRKHTTGKNSLRVSVTPANTPGAPAVDMTKGTDAETQLVVDSIMPCGYEVFKAAVYCGQEEMPDLPRKTDKELKMLVEEAAGMNRIEAAYVLARKRAAEAAQSVSMLTVAFDAAKLQIGSAQASLDAVTKDSIEWENQRARRVQEAKDKLAAVVGEMTTIAKSLLADKPQYLANQNRIAEIDAELQNHSALDGAALKAAQTHQRAAQAVESVQLRNFEGVVRSITSNIDNVDAAMAIPCGECGKPHTPEEKDEYLRHQQGLLEKANAQLATHRDKVRLQVAAVQVAKAAEEAARAKVPDVSAVSAERTHLVATNKVYDDRQKALQRLTGDRTAHLNSVALRESEPNPQEVAIMTLKAQIVAGTTKLADIETQLAEAKVKVEVAEVAVKVFGPAGLRAQILDSVTPFLNERTADYLSVLTDGHATAVWTTLTKTAAGGLKESFSIEATDDQGADNFDGLSGGEKKKVRLACNLALQDLVASRATAPVDLWIGDEIDEALDEAGLERLMVILERKARERGTVLVISHNSLTDWADQVTVVTKKDKVSRIEGALCA